VIPPPAGFTTQDLEDAVRTATTHAAVGTPPHPDKPDGWHLAWGEQVDVKHISLTGHGD
jgi:hypothetical protein